MYVIKRCSGPLIVYPFRLLRLPSLGKCINAWLQQIGPDGSGKIFQTSTGKYYKLNCHKMVGGDNLNSQACEPQKDALSCVERCAQTVGCKSVDWYQSKCCFKTYNSKDGTAPYENGGIDSWIEVSAPAPTPVSPPKCTLSKDIHSPTVYPLIFCYIILTPGFVIGPEGSGKIFQTSGKYYKLNCNKMINEDNLNSQACEPQTNYLLCATRCAQVVGCKSVNWYQNKCCFKAYTSKDGTPPTEWTGGDSWVEVPDPSAAAAPVPAPAPAPVDGEKDHSCSAPGANGVIYTCPADDRKTYTAM
jgi:predicted ABC-type ATPase